MSLITSLAVKQFTGWTTADLVRMSKTGEAIWGARGGEATRPEAGEAEAPLKHEHTQGTGNRDTQTDHCLGKMPRNRRQPGTRRTQVERVVKDRRLRQRPKRRTKQVSLKEAGSVPRRQAEELWKV